MDTKQLNQLDPKLKETYERIMGTKTAPSPSPKPVQPQAIQPPSPSPKNPSPFPASLPQAAQGKQQPTPKPLQPPLGNQTQATTIQSDAKTPTPQPILQPAQATKKSNNMRKILIVIGAVIFIIVYALVWIKILM